MLRETVIASASPCIVKFAHGVPHSHFKKRRKNTRYAYLSYTRLPRRPRQGPTAFVFNTRLHTIYSIADTKYSTMQQLFGAGENVEGMKLGRSPLLFSSLVDRLLRALRPAPFVFLSLE
jgi:hypothetical protein